MNSVLEQAASASNAQEAAYTMKDFKSDQEVRWCPGCGDYAILSQMQKMLPSLGIAKEKVVFVSGIGCSSRFPYYMDTFGFHSIHGRAPALATGLKIARPDLSIWIITGDGDGLSIGGNHLIHILRRNIDVNILLFNNEIYGLTKGQYSPTSAPGLVTKSTPLGSLDSPFNPLSLALGAQGSFVARTMDRDLKHLQETLRRAAAHKGCSFVEIYQNCIVFNDGVFDEFTDKSRRPDSSVYLEHGKPLVFGADRQQGISFDGHNPRVISLANGKYSIDDVAVFDEHDQSMAFALAQMDAQPELPRAFGILHASARSCYEDQVQAQIDAAVRKQGPGDLRSMLFSGDSWEVRR